ncbi:MAG: altronate dehydratase family protein [Clostridiales bacterium]|jgi:altronate hydrolase|nr:altronate dehydratase family protein [Clostridiales bacterium]
MNILQINPRDNVSVVLEPVRTAGRLVDFGHKIALKDIPAGDEVIKYGCPIGRASIDIKAGEWVHTHNVVTGLGGGRRFYEYMPAFAPRTPRESGVFMGFKRHGGKIGIRNEIWIIPTVGCVNDIGRVVAQKARGLITGGVEGVYCFPHPYGCSQLGEDQDNTIKALSGLIKHPNAGGALVLGLGCENCGISIIKGALGDIDGRRVKFLNCQDEQDEIEAALRLLGELFSAAGQDAREPVPASELIVGLKCGGSDGFSGITANPLAGALSDRLIDEGGSAILTEVPEMFGAETILMNRCKNEAVFQKTVLLIENFKEYYERHGQPVFENPSPGNKAGGITTLEDKALGCTQKAGTAAVSDVLPYGGSLKEKGVNLLQAPGNDLVASTALAVSGAHLILFTTGRGTPFGAPVPTVKISSNTPLYNKKRNWIDFDAGPLASGASLEALADELYEYVIKLASGEVLTKTEQNGMREIAVFKNGVTL